MTNSFAAMTLTHTSTSDDGRRLAVSLADASGCTQSVTLTPELAEALCRILQDFASATPTHNQTAPLTKLPQTFAVGSGVHESVVLIRFERDAPYALAPDDAAELGHALLEQCQHLDARPARQLQ